MVFSHETKKKMSSFDRDEVYDSGSKTVSRMTSASCHSSPLSSTMDIVYNKLGIHFFLFLKFKKESKEFVLYAKTANCALRVSLDMTQFLLQ